MQIPIMVAAVTLFPFIVVLALLRLVDRLERRRAEVVARQIELTDAIHRELGAVVAPRVTRRPWGRWRVSIAVPLDRPALVGRVLDVVYGAFRGRFDLVLTPTAPRARPAPRRLEPAREGRPSWA
jgi:hypothetical protein